MKSALIVALHLLAVCHAAFIFQKENQNHLDGVFFVVYVISITLYWKKIAKKKKSEYASKTPSKTD